MKKAFFVLLTVLLLLTSCAGIQKDKIENTKDDSESTQKRQSMYQSQVFQIIGLYRLTHRKMVSLTQ